MVGETSRAAWGLRWVLYCAMGSESRSGVVLEGRGGGSCTARWNRVTEGRRARGEGREKKEDTVGCVWLRRRGESAKDGGSPPKNDAGAPRDQPPPG